MPRPSKTDQELAYLRSAWEEVEEQAVEYNFILSIQLVPTISRGVWSVVIVAYSREVDEKNYPVITERATFRFPSGRSVTFAGELWSVLHRFTNQLGEARDAWTRRAQ